MLRWLNSIRYKVALAFLVVLTLSAVLYPSPLVSTLSVVALVLVYLAMSGIYDLFLRGSPSAKRIGFIQQIQLPVELVLFSVAIYVSGGVLTPMFMIYILTIVVSIILLDAVGVYRTAGIAALLYCALALIENYHALPYMKGYWGEKDYYEVASSATYALFVLAVASILMMTAYMASRVALLIEQRNTQIEHQLNDLHTLYNITNGLGNISDEDKMMRYLAEVLERLQNASLCLVGLFDKDGHIVIKASSGVSPDGLKKLHQLSRNSSEFEGLFQRGEPLIIEDATRHPEYEIFRIRPGTKSAFIFPIKSDTEVLGAISLSFDRVRPLSNDYNDLLTAITAQAGAALQRARLFSEAQRMALEMTTLYDVGLHTGSTLSLHEVFRRTAASIEKLMNPDTYYIALYEAATETLTFDWFVESGQMMPKMRMALSDGGLTAQIVRTGKSLLVHDWLSDGAPYNEVAKRIGTDMLSYLGVPLISHDKVIGVISVQCARPLAFDETDERLLTALAAQTAMAFENARLHKQAQDQATRDSLTQLHNHGYFVELVQKRLAASEKDGSQVSLIMLDVDHFKRFNDTYGHQAGNNVLQMVAHVLRSSTKSKDVAARWGGEEFALLLPNADMREAKKVARRIQKALAATTPVDGHGNPIPCPTVSQGIASYPSPCDALGVLIEHADAALYHAKKQGRNQLATYDVTGVYITEHETTPLHAAHVAVSAKS